MAAPLIPLLVYWSSVHSNNAVVANNASIASLDSTYTYVGPNLAISPVAFDGAAPLYFYVNHASNHTMTTSSVAGIAYAQTHGFVAERVEGWVMPVKPSSSEAVRPLRMWYSAKRDDMFLVGTSDHADDAAAAGYTILYVDCYVPAPPTAWRSWPNLPPADLPFELSNALSDFEYDAADNAVPPGIHADTWYPAWSADGDLYSSWTDGSVFGVSSSSAGHSATTGFAIVAGADPWSLVLSNISTYAEPATPYGGRYPSLNAHVDGVWYYGTYSLEDYGAWYTPGPDCGNWCIQGAE